eukprot:jgi/Bigna1/78057/fgenesh1_pg.52_\
MVVAGKRPGWERKALQCCRNIKDVDFGRSADTSFNPKLKVFGRTLRDFLSVIIETRAALLRASIAPPPSQLEIEREVAVIGLDPGGPPGFAERVAEWEERQRRAAPTLQRSMQQRYGVKLVSVLEFVMSAVRKTQRSRIIIVGDKSGGALYDCKVLLRSAGVGTAHFEGNLRHRTKGDENNRFILAERQSFSPPARSAHVILDGNGETGMVTHVCMLGQVLDKEQFFRLAERIERMVNESSAKEKTCEIVHFVVKDTMEEEIYRRESKDTKGARNDDEITVLKDKLVIILIDDDDGDDGGGVRAIAETWRAYRQRGLSERKSSNVH